MRFRMGDAFSIFLHLNKKKEKNSKSEVKVKFELQNEAKKDEIYERCTKKSGKNHEKFIEKDTKLSAIFTSF